MGFDRDQGYRNVYFDGSASYDPDGGSVQEYSWTRLTDPFPDEARYHQCSFTETFDEPGAYSQIKLYVTDDEQVTDWEYCHLYLVEALLNVYYAGEWMDDPDEYDEGAFIMLNDDDDNGNGVADNDPGEITVADENDLVSLYVFTDPLPTYLQEGQLTLEIVSGASKITVWRYNPDPPYNLLHVVSSSQPSKTWDMEDVDWGPFLVEGMQPSGGYRDVELKLTYACGSESSVDKVRITVLQVQSVQWLGVDPGDGTNLSNDNPGSHGGGWRIFPGKNTPTGQLHHKVKAKATINVTMPADRTSKVYFQVFDMDDPTQNGADNVVDASDTATAYNGGDNKGAGPGITPSGTQEATVSGGTSFAKLEYTVTHRNPGNNFRVVAHCIADYLGDVIIDTGAAKKGLDFKLGDSGPMVPANYKTPLLSVWRKLHVEFDKMDNAPAGELFGEIDGTSSSITTNTLTAQGNPGWAADSLHGGVLNPDATEAANTLTHGTNWEVIDNTNNTVTVKTDYSSDTFDNDGQNDADDEGEEWEMTPHNPSNKSFAIETDDVEWLSDGCKPPTNAAAIVSLNDCYEIAYIECFEAQGNTHDTFDFRRNCENEGQRHGNQLDVADDYAAEFWVVAIAWSYEAFSKYDSDPPCETHGRKTVYCDDDPEGEGTPNQDGNWRCIRGKAVNDLETKGGPVADVYVESTRDDGEYSVMFVAAHEIGHLLGLSHAWYGGQQHPEEFLEDDNGIMAWSPAIICDHDWKTKMDEEMPDLHFRPCNNNINELRSTANPFTW